MPDTDSYDSSMTGENLSQASQRTAEASQKQKEQNMGGQDATGSIFGKKKTPATATSKPDAAPSGGLVGAIKGAFKKGGTVTKTGNYKLHEGEEVLPKGRASEYRKIFTQRGKDGKHKYSA